ncbi:hypothetical protein ACVIWU_006578 [Bradyrhizobium sp. USDA 4509]
MQPHALDGNDVFNLCFQTYVGPYADHAILVDSCLGNHKVRYRPEWHMKTDDTYMRALAQAGLSVEDIDCVMCKYLHGDQPSAATRGGSTANGG